MKRLLACVLALALLAGCAGGADGGGFPFASAQAGKKEVEEEAALSPEELAYAGQQAAFLTGHLLSAGASYRHGDGMEPDINGFVLAAALSPRGEDADAEDWMAFAGDPGYDLYAGFFGVDGGDEPLYIYPVDAVNQMVYEVFGLEEWHLRGGAVLNADMRRYESALALAPDPRCRWADMRTEAYADSTTVAATFLLHYPSSDGGDPSWASDGYHTITWTVMREDGRLFLRYAGMELAAGGDDGLSVVRAVLAGCDEYAAFTAHTRAHIDRPENLHLLEAWIECYRRGEPARTAIFMEAAFSDHLYILEADGTAAYTVTEYWCYHGDAEARVISRSAGEAWDRTVDYVIDPEGESPLSVYKVDYSVEELAVEQLAGALTPEEIADMFRAELPELYFSVSGAAAVRGIPCCIVWGFPDEQAMLSGNYSGYGWAVSMDGALRFSADEAHGGWVLDHDANVEVIRPG